MTTSRDNIGQLIDKADEWYAAFYDEERTNPGVSNLYQGAVQRFDAFLKENGDAVRAVVAVRGDAYVSDRETASFVSALVTLTLSSESSDWRAFIMGEE